MTATQIAELLASEMEIPVNVELSGKLARYLDRLDRWNARMNLTAIRDERQIVLRHFGECLQCAWALPGDVTSLLDYGSGAGFPGLVCALARPGVAVLLAESQAKKAAFLQEACRAIPASAEVYAGRVEALPKDRQFDAVTMRAVDRLESALVHALNRVRDRGWLVVMTTRGGQAALFKAAGEVVWSSPIEIRGTDQGVVALGQVFRK